MANDATVTAADIARLAGVGRAAVSNWRRRHDDFPRPVGGTASSPTFSLAEIEGWLRDQGKLAASPEPERVWQALRQAAVDGVGLADVLTFSGAFLLFLKRVPERWPELSKAPDEEIASVLPGEVRVATEDVCGFPSRLTPDHVPLAHGLAGLAAERGVADAFEFLRTRYLEHHSRRVYITPEPVVRLMLDLGGATRGTVFDPACGTGMFLSTAHEVFGGVDRLLGEEIDETTARLTAIQLALRDMRAEVRPGDSLLSDAFPGADADLVVSNPPFNERNWGYDQLTGDPRWEYGLPPRMESELAWVQHGLAHARPGAPVILLMPPAVANRRSGRRIRAELLRRGALRAVIGLPLGAVPNMAVALSVWVLRRPAPGDQPPDDVLMVDASGHPDDVHDVALNAWNAYRHDPESIPDGATVVRIIDLLDEEVDLTPARYLPQRSAPEAEGAFTAARERLEATAADLPRKIAALAGVAEETRERPAWGTGGETAMTTIGELAKANALQILRGPARPDPGDVPLLTVDDVVAGRPASGGAAPDDEHVRVQEGDVVVSSMARHPVAVVAAGEGALLGPHLHIVRVDPAKHDPHFVAGWLRLAVRGVQQRSSTASARFDVRRARLPRLPIAEQAGYGAAFRTLSELEAVLRETQEQAESVLWLGLEGLGAGTLRPRA